MPKQILPQTTLSDTPDEAKRRRKSGNSGLKTAQQRKNDEFYTRLEDIQNEVNAYVTYNPDVFRDKTLLLPCDDPEWSKFTRYFAQNFERLGLKKLISTSYAPNSKNFNWHTGPNEYEMNSPLFDCVRSQRCGRIFVIDKDITGDGKIDYDDIHWKYLKGDGDYHSDEVRRLLDEADVVVTNPPFSLFPDFIKWVTDAGKDFLLLANTCAITYTSVFPLIVQGKLWLGATNFNRGMYFYVPDAFQYDKSYKFKRELNGHKVSRVSTVCWFTNLEHAKRHEPLSLMTMEDCVKHIHKKEFREGSPYVKYDNYDAIEVPRVEAIPCNYDGVMGVPITFLDKFCPEQFEILGATESEGAGFSFGLWNASSGDPHALVKGKAKFKRLFIRKITKE